MCAGPGAVAHRSGGRPAVPNMAVGLTKKRTTLPLSSESVKVPAMKSAPSTNGSNGGRDARGRFATGNSGGPGSP